MVPGYDPILVALSYVISVFGSYSALRLAVKIPGASRDKLPIWLGASAVAMGGGAIWSMHFIGMLAYRTPFPVTYDPLITAASMAIAIVATGCGLYLVGRNPASRGRLAGASVFTGLGVASMHYTGMYAMKMPAHLSWHPGLVLLSILIAVGASFAALWLAFNLHGNLQRIGSAFVMGLAISGMHYTGMLAMRMAPMEHGAAAPGGGGLGPSDLAIGVFLVTVVGVLLLSATQDQELEQRNKELDEARRQAVLQSEFKSRFLAGVSHELRTPLTAILGFAELLEQELQGRLDARHKEFMELITASARHLLGLVNEVLDLSRIEAGHLVIEPARVEIGELVGSAVAGLKSLAALRGVELRIAVPDDLPPLHVDPMRIKQVLYNLLSNAIKFTASGGSVSLAVRVEGERMYLSVADTGIGIRGEDLPRLFQEFERLTPPPGAPPAPEGTGLGLALSRRLVEKHGGTITVESVPGSGSTFTVCLPIRLPGAPDRAAEAAPSAPARREDGKPAEGAPAQPARILLVEDDPTVRLLIRLVLEHRGHTIVEAGDAAEARSQLDAERPDLILLDIHFPGGGGELLLSEIRARQDLDGVPTLAVTAAAMEGDRERLLAHGFDGYISKPIELSSFGAEVDCWLRKAN